MKKKIKEDEEIKVIPCEVYSRVVGYYRPMQDWNDGKREEFRDRNYLTIKEEK